MPFLQGMKSRDGAEAGRLGSKKSTDSEISLLSVDFLCGALSIKVL